MLAPKTFVANLIAEAGEQDPPYAHAVLGEGEYDKAWIRQVRELLFDASILGRMHGCTFKIVKQGIALHVYIVTLEMYARLFSDD